MELKGREGIASDSRRATLPKPKPSLFRPLSRFSAEAYIVEKVRASGFC